MKSFGALASLAFVSGASARTFTVYNGCPFTIWCVNYILEFLLTEVDRYETGLLYALSLLLIAPSYTSCLEDVH